MKGFPMTDLYAIKFTRQGLDYVRQVLGGRPYDEAGPLIANIEVQRREQDEPLDPPLSTPVQPQRTAKRGRPPIQHDETMNGAGANGAAS